MPGIVVPSLLERSLMSTRSTLAQINDRGKWGDRGVHRLGNGLLVTQSGEVVVEPRLSPPSQAETEDMTATFEKFALWLRSEGAHQMAREERSQAQQATGEQIVEQANDSVINYPAAITPADLAYEFGTPIDVTEIIALCEETGLYTALPEVINGSKYESWRELESLVNCSGTAYISFSPGDCPDFMCNTTGAPKQVEKKHIGKMTTLTESDIQHSIASIAAGYGVKWLLGAALPAGSAGNSSLVRESIKSLMDKEIKKQQVLVINGWDYLLVKGNDAVNSTEFDGVENYITAANGARVNPNSAAYSGTFSATRFDEFLAAGCAKPTHIMGHPTALQALQLGYWALGSQTYSNAQVVSWQGPARNIVPGLTFAGALQTAVGLLPLIGDTRFTRTDHSDGSFSSTIFPVRMTHDGEPLVYRATQIPLSFKELTPGCSAISFETWAVTALVIKFMCAQARYTAKFQGLVGDGCSYVFG
jgi:hypothetical protein